MMNRDNPVWLITGCSTGFGRELAKLVLERGWRAVVTARDASKVKDIAEAHGNRRDLQGVFAGVARAQCQCIVRNHCRIAAG